MEKKVMLITGATGGLGKEMAHHFAAHGNYILALHAFESQVFQVEAEHHWFFADLRDRASIERLCSEVLEKYGRVDILINNAGISRNGMSWKLAANDWNEVIAVNLTAPFELIKNLVPSMRANGFGRIISISSVVAQTGVPGTAAYAASKAGLLGLTKTVAKETATSGITVNALALGYFDTGMITEVSPEMQQAIVAAIPKQRLGDVPAILSALGWLISSEADYVTGQTISLNGGLHT